jgi:hypothetical protein
MANSLRGHMMVRGLIERDQAATRYALTEQGAPCWRHCLAHRTKKRAPRERSQVNRNGTIRGQRPSLLTGPDNDPLG